MSGAVAFLPNQQSVDAAWEQYQRLVQAALENPRLNLDREHVEARILAHKRFQDAFLAWGERQ